MDGANNDELRRERPERAASSQPRATPWVSAYKALRPVRAKVWANGWLLLLPLQGAGAVRTLTQGVALGILCYPPNFTRTFCVNICNY